MLARAGLLYRTLRHVPLEQLWFYLLRRGICMRVGRRMSSGVPRSVMLSLTLTQPLPPVEPVLQQGRFCFLHQSATFGLDAPDWRAAGMPKLWRYHLHYFDWLKDADPDHSRCAFSLDHWIAHNPPGSEDAWEPYTVSLRLINWIGYCYRRQQQGLDVKRAWVDSIVQQGSWLMRNLEFHIRANHLLKNRFALVWFRLFCRTSSADAALLQTCADLQAELLEQFNADGGHYERSPTYHAICLEHCIALSDALQAAAVSTPLRHTLRSVIEKGIVFLQALSFTDGKVALMGDSTLQGGHNWKTLRGYWQRVNGCASDGLADHPALQHFADTGFVIWQQDHCKLVISTAGPNPAYQPGHAHCDAGSFELEVQGRRVIVDSGVSQYAPGSMRHYVRSSRAHNVLTVEDQDQNEIWGEFRIGARLVMSHVTVRKQGDIAQIVLDMHSHAAAPIQYRHRRIFRLDVHQIHITDEVVLGKSAWVHNRLHVHPAFQLQACGRDWFLDHDMPVVIRIEAAEMIRQQLEPSYYCPDFGVVLANQCLLLSKHCSQQDSMAMTICLQPGNTVVNT